MIRTPGDLSTMRMLLGLQPSQLAEMLGTKADDIKTLEKMRTHFIYRGHADLLTEMLVKVDSLISELTADNVEPPEFLFTFPN